jgi:hypothetical protein
MNIIIYHHCNFACCQLVASLAYFSTLKMEVVRPSEPSVNFYQSTRHHIPEDISLHSYPMNA